MVAEASVYGALERRTGVGALASLEAVREGGADDGANQGAGDLPAAEGEDEGSPLVVPQVQADQGGAPGGLQSAEKLVSEGVEAV